MRAKRGGVSCWYFDAGLANAHLLLGVSPSTTWGTCSRGRGAGVAVDRARPEAPLGGVGRQNLINPTRRELDRLFKALRPLEEEFDLIVIDHGAGLGYSTVAHLAATSTLVLVTNPELTALSDAYALYKRAVTVNPQMRVGVVVNRVGDEGCLAAWERFAAPPMIPASEPDTWAGPRRPGRESERPATASDHASGPMLRPRRPSRKSRTGPRSTTARAAAAYERRAAALRAARESTRSAGPRPKWWAFWPLRHHDCGRAIDCAGPFARLVATTVLEPGPAHPHASASPPR